MAKKTIFKAKGGNATATHYKEGERDVVEIGDLRVLVVQDDKWWFAQGLEIDCSAQGRSEEEVKQAFLRSLVATAHAYLTELGSIQKFLRPAPPEVLRELVGASSKGLLSISTVSEHEIERIKPPVRESLPFSGITFYRRVGEPAGAAL
jgi:hypothetical protein